MKNLNMDTLIAILILIIVMGPILVFIILPNDKKEEVCRDNGYSIRDTTGSVEQGYILCCNKRFVEHIQDGYDCKAFKYGGS